LLRRVERGRQLQLAFADPKVSSFHAEWDKAAERENKARAFFAQHGIKPDEVAREMREIDPVLGSPEDVHHFVANAIQRFNGSLKETIRKGIFQLHPGDLHHRMLARAPHLRFPLEVAFTGVPPDGVTLIGRNHPVVVTLTEAVIAQSISGDDPRFARCGAIYTTLVNIRTAVLVLRLRYSIEEVTQQFAEEIVVAAFRRSDQGIEWLRPLEEEGLRSLSQATASANMPLAERERHVSWALGVIRGAWYESIVQERVSALQDSHSRLRAQTKTTSLTVIPHTPPDILGCYVLVPSGGSE